MNILLDGLPKTLNGYRIDSDFRIMLKLDNIMNGGEVKDKEQLANVLASFYLDPPADVKSAVDGLAWFYKCGKESADKTGNSENNVGAGKYYDFLNDADYIYSAFLSQYSIDLSNTPLHWWKFCALFKGLDDNNLIVKIIGWRSMDLKGLSKEQKAVYQRLKKTYALNVCEQKESLLERNEKMIDYVEKRLGKEISLSIYDKK